MIGPSPVEELAWLVKDNLQAKYLVVSVEELFVEFLECPLSEEDTLALEPMVSYQRMLLHRLADLFGLAHESVGEGHDRHLIVEKCDDSLIPAVLVSDMLDAVGGDEQHQHLGRQILKRDAPPADGTTRTGPFHADSFQTPPASKSCVVPLEERQVAYSAARRRIFSETWKCGKDTSTETESTRPRSDPKVARRMIAHALGKSKELTYVSPSSDFIPAQDLQSQASVSGVGDKMLGENPGNGRGSVSAESKESMQKSSVGAARRMFANALGLPHSVASSKLTSPVISSETGTCPVSRKRGEVTRLNSSLQRNWVLDTIPGDSVEPTHRCGSSDTRASGRTLKARSAPLGGAGCRIFAQALGLRDPVFN